MNQAAIRKRFDEFLRTRSLKLTKQREQIFERAFATHEHFTADVLHRWMIEDKSVGVDNNVSRATVYRTLSLLEEGGFIGSLDSGRGELMYEHLLGHEHHDHLICRECGKIEEFRNAEIEALQEAVAKKFGFTLIHHTLRLEGHCKQCTRELAKRPEGSTQP
ncbi:MAG: Fur family ferric uptake transcriptional regulator [Planctomycetota bacterium]|jgi:Fur family ferric uptake transcriptional regulator